MTAHGQNLSRWLAPLALVVCALAVVIIIGGARSNGSGSSSGTAAEQRAASTTTSTTKRKAKKAKKKTRTYTVKPGDTLSGIAQQTSVPLSELQELNPNLDSESLQSGQKVKLGP